MSAQQGQETLHSEICVSAKGGVGKLHSDDLQLHTGTWRKPLAARPDRLDRLAFLIPPWEHPAQLLSAVVAGSQLHCSAHSRGHHRPEDCQRCGRPLPWSPGRLVALRAQGQLEPLGASREKSHKTRGRCFKEPHLMKAESLEEAQGLQSKSDCFPQRGTLAVHNIFFLDVMYLELPHPSCNSEGQKTIHSIISSGYAFPMSFQIRNMNFTFFYQVLCCW